METQLVFGDHTQYIYVFGRIFAKRKGGWAWEFSGRRAHSVRIADDVRSA